MEGRELIYISGPISGRSVRSRWLDFEQKVADLYAQGWAPVNPISLFSMAVPYTHEQYMKVDLAILMQCDAIYMMDGWEDSAGCMAEYGVARAAGIPIIFEGENE